MFFVGASVRGRPFFGEKLFKVVHNEGVLFAKRTLYVRGAAHGGTPLQLVEFYFWMLRRLRKSSNRGSARNGSNCGS